MPAQSRIAACMDRGCASPVPPLPTMPPAAATGRRRLHPDTGLPPRRVPHATSRRPLPSHAEMRIAHAPGESRARRGDRAVALAWRAALCSGVALDAADQVVDLVVLAAIVVQPARDLLHRVEHRRVVAPAELAPDRRAASRPSARGRGTSRAAAGRPSFCERLGDSSSGTGMPKASDTTCLIVATETGDVRVGQVAQRLAHERGVWPGGRSARRRRARA